MEQTSTAVSEPAEAPSIAPAVVEDEEPDDAVHVMGDDAQANAVQDSFLAPPEQTASTSVAYPPRRDEEAPRGRRGLGLFLGGAVGAGAALGVILSGVWVPPELPWHAEFLFANLISWVGFFCLGGALLGFLLGGSRRS